MGFRNPCCRAQFIENGWNGTPSVGKQLTCATCGNQFVHDGKVWVHRLELGQRKIDKLIQASRWNAAAPAREA